MEKEDKNRQKKVNLCSLLLKLYIVCMFLVCVCVFFFGGGGGSFGGE